MANLLDQASIVLTPTAYKNSRMMCVKPSDASGDFTFSRNSAATRVNAKGLVENVQILSGNLVQNGDFSEEGVQEVSNGSFSQEGSEEIINGDFATDSDWTKGTGWSIGENKAICIGNSGHTSLTQSNSFLLGKTYKVTFDIVVDSGNFTIQLLGSGSDSGNIISSTQVGYTEYISPTSNRTVFAIRSNDGSGIGSITNISVKEVGQDWDLGTGWSIGEDKVIVTSTINQQLKQTLTTTIGKSYKVSLEILDITEGSIRIYLRDGGTAYFVGGIYASSGVYDFYFTSTETLNTFAVYPYGTTTASITNISVKEVAQNWNLSGVDFSLGSVFFDNVNDNIFQGGGYFSSGTKYKLTFEGSGNLAYRTGFAGADGTRKQITLPHTAYLTATADTNRIQAYGAIDGSQGTLTSVVVIEITDDTNLPRINYEGFSYQDALGSEEIVNGDFATDTAWLKQTGWTISGGKANSAASVGSVYKNPQTYVLGKSYKVTYTISDYVSGSLRVVWGSYIGITNNSNGTYTEIMTPTGANQFYLAASGGAFIGSIDNVSVKEYLGQEVVPDSGCGHWLWEPQSTNLITQSELFSDSSWANTYTLIPNSVVSPSGELNAFKIVVGTTNGNLRTIVSVLSNTKYVFSFYAKRGTASEMKYRVYDFTNSTDIVPKTSYYSQTNTDSWVRIEVSFTTSATTTSIGCYIDSDSQGNGSFYAWGAMLEQGNISSYIPTSGATVTRNQDVCTNGGSLASINSTEGTLYAEIAALADDGTNRVISLNSGQRSNSVRLYFDSSGLGEVTMQVRSGNVLQVIEKYVLSNLLDFNKIAIKYKENDFALWVNGIEVNTDTSGITPIGLDTLSFNDGSLDNFFGKTKALAVWKEALSDEELQSLTTI